MPDVNHRPPHAYAHSVHTQEPTHIHPHATHRNTPTHTHTHHTCIHMQRKQKIQHRNKLQLQVAQLIDVLHENAFLKFFLYKLQYILNY